jgi:Tfp pilus assembly protein PilF
VISALADHHEAIRRSPEDSTGYLDRAEDYEAIGENERALSDCNEAIRLEPSRRAYMARASLYRALGEDEKTESDEEAARQYAE